MGMALLRRMKKGGKAGGGPPLTSAKGEALMPEPALHLPAPRPAPAYHAGVGHPVVHIHIGPSSAADESPEEELPESAGVEAGEPILLRALHDKISAARAAGRK